MPTQTDVLLELPVSRETYNRLKSQVTPPESLETLVARKLDQISLVESKTPIILDDEAKRQLDGVLGRNLQNADHLVSSVARALQIHVDGLEIQLSPALLQRLQSRCIGVEWEKFIKTTVTRALEQFVGMR